MTVSVHLSKDSHRRCAACDASPQSQQPHRRSSDCCCGSVGCTGTADGGMSKAFLDRSVCFRPIGIETMTVTVHLSTDSSHSRCAAALCAVHRYRLTQMMRGAECESFVDRSVLIRPIGMRTHTHTHTHTIMKSPSPLEPPFP